jgi:uncharacterized protein DUF2721
MIDPVTGLATDLAHVIQLSVAPVFLLVAIFSFLNVVTQRLGRVIDRARTLEQAISCPGEGEEIDLVRQELADQGRRMTYANWAINLASISAFLIALVVAVLFLGNLLAVNVDFWAALLFILSMLGIIGGLVSFLFEVSIATGTIHIRNELIAKKDDSAKN